MIWSRLSAFYGASGVLLAAFGAHGLERVTDAKGLRWWAIGVALQLVTAPALLSLSGFPESRARTLAGGAFCAGILLFSGTLYAMALGAPRFLGAVTPLGGLSLCAAWLLTSAAKRST